MVKKQSTKTSQVRIIGGHFKGRKIFFPEIPGLRPTPNRIRETLFNWLAPYIYGASCLDLFAGSGALSFEAISRGASNCLMLDSSPEITHALTENKRLLGLTALEIVCAKFPYSYQLVTRTFNIVFVDPPFHQGYIPLVIEWLQNCQCLAVNTLIYIESESDTDVLILPDNWQLLRDKKTGNVRYSLIRVA